MKGRRQRALHPTVGQRRISDRTYPYRRQQVDGKRCCVLRRQRTLPLRRSLFKRRLSMPLGCSRHREGAWPRHDQRPFRFSTHSRDWRSPAPYERSSGAARELPLAECRQPSEEASPLGVDGLDDLQCVGLGGCCGGQGTDNAVGGNAESRLDPFRSPLLTAPSSVAKSMPAGSSSYRTLLA